MEHSIDMIINLILYCLYLLLFIGTLVGGFISPALGLQLAVAIVPAIMILTAIWLLVTGWDYVLQALAILLSIATNGLNFVIGNIATFIGACWVFLAGMGEAALIAAQGWAEGQLAIMLSWIEPAFVLLGMSAETGTLAADASVSLLGGSLAIVTSGIGTVLVTLGYGFGSVVVILLNLVALATSTLTILTGAGPTLATLAGGAVALLALPFIVKALLALIAHAIHLVGIFVLRITFPLWQSSWLLGWVVKMLASSIALAFYLERSVTHRPNITLSWDGQQWAVA